MNRLSNLLVLTTALFLYSCGADIQNNDKIDGRWYLDSTSGGIHGGGFLVEGEVYMEIKGTDIDLYHKDALIMNARFDYKYDDYDNLFIKIDRSYKEEEPSFRLGYNDKFFVAKDSSSTFLYLTEPCCDQFAFNFSSF